MGQLMGTQCFLRYQVVAANRRTARLLARSGPPPDRRKAVYRLVARKGGARRVYIGSAGDVEARVTQQKSGTGSEPKSGT